jgi:hypothetical protein
MGPKSEARSPEGGSPEGGSPVGSPGVAWKVVAKKDNEEISLIKEEKRREETRERMAREVPTASR